MNFLKKIPIIICFVFLFSTTCGALIKNKIIVTVGETSITSYDLKTEIKFLNIINGGALEKESPDVLKKIGIQSLISRAIKLVEINNYQEIEVSDEHVQKKIYEISKSLGLSRDQLKKIFLNNKVPFSLLIKDLQTNFRWNSVIFELYKNKIEIDEEKITKKLNEIKKKSFFNEYLLSEILLKPVTADKIESTVNQAMSKINELGFEKAALEISISESLKNKGSLGWIKETSITEEILQKISKTKIGSVTEPIFVAEGIIIMKVVDKRKKENKIDLKYAAKLLRDDERNKKLNRYSMLHFQKLKNYITITTH